MMNIEIKLHGDRVNLPQIAVDAETMRHAMRKWATGVTIVSSVNNGVRHGMTVSSFLSVSVEPPMILVSLQASSRTHRLVKASGLFGVTILDGTQQAISDRFAGRHTERLDRFRGLETFTLVTGVPFPIGGLAYFDCQVTAEYEISGHTMFVGRVLAIREGVGISPLIYYSRDYHHIEENEDHQSG
jgi:flavin reductase (DIM6/NTAB) family NADH-FMN oxidoreductase RutF